MFLPFLAVAFCWSPQSVLAVDYYVSTSGHDKNSGISPKSPFLTLNHAILQCNSGADRIFVTAGTYEVSVSRVLSSPNATLQIIGDTAGKFTGVKGYPEITSPPNTWAINLRNGGMVGFQGLTFSGSSDGKHYGVHVNNIRNGVIFHDCRFEKLYQSTYALDSACSVDNCQFRQVSYLNLYSVRGSMTVGGCQFVNCRYGVYANAGETFLKKCHFESDGSVTRLAVYSNGSSLSVAGLSVRGYNTAIQAVNSSDLSVNDCTIENITSYGVHATGSKLHVANVTVKNNEQEGYGVCLRPTKKGDARISNTTVHGAYGGILSYDADCAYRNVRLENNRIGFYSANAGRGAMRGSGDLHITENYIGIHVVNPASNPGSFDFQDLTVSNNDYGLYTTNTSVNIHRSVFLKNSRGLYVLGAPTATVSRCEFLDNNVRNTWSHWGARIEASRINIERCSFERNDTGLVLVNHAQDEPQLSNISILDNLNYGLRVYGGPLQISNKMRVQIQGSNYGLWTQDANCTIQQWDAPMGASYPIYLNRGSLVMSGCNINGGSHGVVTIQATSVGISNCKFANLTSYSLYDNQSTSLTVDACDFVEGNHLAIYANASAEASFIGCKFADLTHSAIYALRQPRLRIAECSINTCKNYGIYCTSASPPSDSATFNNLEISNCQYGIRTVGVPVHEKNMFAVGLYKNQQALRVEQADLRLNNSMKIQAEGNQYAFMCYSGNLSSEAFTTAGNTIGFYADKSGVSLIDTSLDCSQDGCLLYGSRVTARDLAIRSVRYGLLFDAQKAADSYLDLDGAEILVSSQIGIYTIGRTLPVRSNLRNVSIEGGRYGLYSNGGQVDVDTLTTKNAQLYGVYSQNSTTTLENVTVEDSKNWSIYGNSGTMDISNSRVFGGNGILLNTLTSGIVNCLVSGSSYGVTTNNANGNYQLVSSTLADIRIDGVRVQRGRLSIVNSIIHAGRFGLVDSRGNSIYGEHNMVMAARQSYRNTQPGINDVEKLPIFVSAPNRDYRLGSGSPGINAGKDLSGVNPRDILGNPRGSFGGHEIGAYEYMEKSGSVRIIDWRETAH